MTHSSSAEVAPRAATVQPTATMPPSLGWTSSRPQEVALLERALQLELSLWHLYCLLGDPQASFHDPPPAVRRAADHRQHIIALRTRLAILGRLPPRPSPLGGLRRMRLQLCQQLGRRGPLLAAIAAAEFSLSELYDRSDRDVLGRPSRLLWCRLAEDLRAGRSSATSPQRPHAPRPAGGGRRYKSDSKHWAYARL